MSKGFKFDSAEPNPQQLAQLAADGGRIMLPLRCECGRETLVNLKGFGHIDEMLAMMEEKLGWTYRTTYLPSVDHVAIRPVCPDCAPRKAKENE